MRSAPIPVAKNTMPIKALEDNAIGMKTEVSWFASTFKVLNVLMVIESWKTPMISIKTPIIGNQFMLPPPPKGKRFLLLISLYNFMNQLQHALSIITILNQWDIYKLISLVHLL